MTESSATETPARSRYFNRHWTWWFMVAVLVLMAAVRLRLLNFSLERDEGEYAYSGQLMLQGIPPYKLAFNMKFPGTYAMYALIMALFGETPAGIHFGVTIITTLTALMLYWLGKKMLDQTAGVVAATTYAVLAANTALFGLAGHAAHFEAFFATAGLCLMWKARESARWQTVGAAGLMCGIAMLMKQHAAVIAVWAFGVFAWDYLRGKKATGTRSLWNPAAFAVGAALPLGLCCLILWCAGVFPQFWFWTVDYARQYVSIVSISDIGSQFWWSVRSMASEDFWLWLPCLAGFVMIWFDERLRQTRSWLLGFTLASLLTTVPGFYFRTHYFLLTLPALGLLAGCAVSGACEAWRRKAGTTRFNLWPTGVYALLLVFSVIKTSVVWSVFSAQGAHALYGAELFPEAEIVSKFIQANSKPDAQIAVLGSEPEIYFLSHRHSATGYIYAYPLMEPQPFAAAMQRDMIREIETNAPEFMVFVNQNFSWVQAPQSDTTIFRWWNDYKTNYTTVGLVEQHWPYPSQFFWGEDAAARGKLNGTGLEIYQRNGSLSFPGVFTNK
jgi:4-amino-4-deoxy-L-arabinose transferase-like glycosyltransferase